MRIMVASGLLAGAALIGAGSAQGGDLKSATIINTAASGGRPCDSMSRTTTWTNTTGQTIYIKKVQVWQTLSQPNSVADMTGNITRVVDGATLVRYPLDSYANPSNTTAIVQNDFSPAQFVLLNGGQLQAEYICVSVFGPAVPYYSMFTVWYTVGAP